MPWRARWPNLRRKRATNTTWEQKRQLVELLIDRVVVTDADVEIHYVIPTTPASEQVRFCHLRTDYFHTVLLLIHLDQFLVGELSGVEDIGGDQERRLAPHRLRHRRFVDRQGSDDVPL